MDYPRFGKEELNLRSCADVLVVVSPANATSLSNDLQKESFPGLVIVEARPGENVSSQLLQAASMAVIEVDPDDTSSMVRLSQLHRDNPNIPIVAAIPDASVALVRTLVREGVSDVISLPLDGDELLEAALAVLAHASTKKDSSTQKLAPMIIVTRSTGGCGATSIATHLAAELGIRARMSRQSAIVDLDLQFGDVAEVLGAEGKGTIIDLLEAGDRLDEDLLASVARQSTDGLVVFAAPKEIVPLESVDTDRLLRVLDYVRRHYDYVVVDVPADWTNWTLSAALSANLIVLIVELSVQSLRHAKRRLDLFNSVGVSSEKISVVVNRFERRLFRTIGLNDVADTLHHPVVASIALDDPAVNSAQDQGRLVTALHRKSRFATDVGRLADALLAGPLGDSN